MKHRRKVIMLLIPVAAGLVILSVLSPRQSMDEPEPASFVQNENDDLASGERIIYGTHTRTGPFKLSSNNRAEDNFHFVLAQANNGDGLSIFQLSSLAIQCRLIDSAADRGELAPAEDESSARTLANCNELPEIYKEDPFRQLRLMAEAGVIEAQVAYPALASQALTQEELLRNPHKAEEFKRDSMRYLHRAAASGAVEALNELAHTYNQGVITQRDPIVAYAYAEAVSRTGLVPSAQTLTKAWGQQLSPSDLRTAHEMADRIYRECCS